MPQRKVFSAKLESARLGLLAVDAYGFVNQVNDFILDTLGFQESDLLDKPLRLVFPDLVDTASGENVHEILRSLATGSVDNRFEAVAVDGTPFQFELIPFESAERRDQLVLMCRDITRSAETEADLYRQRQILAAEMSQVADAILHLNERGYLEYANPVALEMLSLGHRRYNHMYVDDILALRTSSGEAIYPCSDAITRECAVNLVQGIFLKSPTGADDIPVMVSASPIRRADGSLDACVVVMRAINESRRISTRLSWHETHDPLTQLINRRQMETEVLRAIESAHNDDTSHALLYIDLYNFSMINDTAGHSAGDELLRQISRLLSKEVGDFDVVGRTGNDEFAILLWQCSLEEVRAEADRILKLISDFSLPWKNRRLKVGVSMGVEFISRDTQSEVDVMLSASAACDIAREAGRNRIHFPNIDKSVKHRHSLSSWATSISEALDDDRFVVYCQRIVSLGQESDVQHYEALVRMLDKNGRIIPPGNFIPAAESYGFIDDIDRWVFDRILATLNAMPPEEQRRYSFAVNLSGNTVGDEKFLNYAVNRLQQKPLAPGCLHFEITETSAVKHFDRATKLITALQALGCQFALDDFGSGLSSFGYLKQLPVNFLKIDGSFISKMETEEVEYSMVSTIHNLARIMGLQTIAECVENQTQQDMLKEMGINFGQGFHFAVPEPLEKIIGG